MPPITSVLKVLKVPGGFFFVSRVKDHHIVKEDVLTALSNDSESARGRNGRRILDSILSEHMDGVVKLIYPDSRTLDYPDIQYSKPDPWLRCFERGEFEDWRVHGDCNLASLYYVDLAGGDGAPNTLFSMCGKIFGLGSKETEGCIVSFPSFYSHCFLPNKSSKRKSVIGFTFNIF